MTLLFLPVPIGISARFCCCGGKNGNREVQEQVLFFSLAEA
jgi:hypothetical protein